MSSPAEIFHSLHRRGDPLRLLNPWDGASARIFADAGALALGTTSAGVSFSLGLPDGEQMTREQAIGALKLIVSCVDVPVTADIESGYGGSAEEVEETVREVIAAGAVGINIEDSSAEQPSALRPAGQAAERIEAARRAAQKEGVRLFINARTDVFLLGGQASDAMVEATLLRFSAFTAAGADGLFAPGANDTDSIATLARESTLPLNVLLDPGGLPVDELAPLGVARVSSGSVPSRATIGLARRLGEEFLESGTFRTAVDAIPYTEINRAFST